MAIVIHILEALATTMLALMAFQIHRAYKAEATLGQLVQRSYKDAVNEFAGAGFVETPVTETSPSERADSVAQDISHGAAGYLDASHFESAAQEVSNAPASHILDDYIGGFFNEPAVPEIREFKAVSYNTGSSKIASSEAVNESSQPDAQPEKLDIQSFKATPTEHAEIPVLKLRVPEEFLTERFVAQRDELDGEVITVDDQEKLSTDKNVMSDKVVLAMLGEAKLASIS